MTWHPRVTNEAAHAWFCDQLRVLAQQEGTTVTEEPDNASTAYINRPAPSPTRWRKSAVGLWAARKPRADDKLTAFAELESAIRKALVYEIQVDQPHVRRRPTLKLGDACLDQFVRVSQPAFVLGGTTASHTCRVWGA